MKKTGDPLKKVDSYKSSADATNVSMNVPKAPMRERMSNIPMRFEEKKMELEQQMAKGGYVAVKDKNGNVVEYKRYPGVMKMGDKEFQNVKGTNTYSRKKP
jgi:hypothetical protein